MGRIWGRVQYGLWYLIGTLVLNAIAGLVSVWVLLWCWDCFLDLTRGPIFECSIPAQYITRDEEYPAKTVIWQADEDNHAEWGVSTDAYTYIPIRGGAEYRISRYTGQLDFDDRVVSIFTNFHGHGQCVQVKRRSRLF